MMKIIKWLFFISVGFVFIPIWYLQTYESIYFEQYPSLKKIENIEINEFLYLKDIYPEKWDTVCVLTPYQGGVTIKETNHFKFFNQKIAFEKIKGEEGIWYLLFKKNKSFYYESFIRKKERDIQQRNFSEDVLLRMTLINFTPKKCVKFNQAIIFKFKINERIYLTLGENSNETS